MGNIGTNSVAAHYIGGNSVASVYKGSTLVWSSAPPPFSPDDIAGLSLWLDADDGSTLTLSGSNVTQWDDKSSNGYDVSQGTTSRQPTLQTGVLNSKDGVRFDGTDDILFNDSAASIASGNDVPVTIFTVYKQLSSGSNEYGLVFGSSTSVQPLLCLMTTSNNMAAQQRTDAGTLTNAYSSTSSLSYRCQTTQLTSSNLVVYNNKTQIQSSSFTPAQTTFDTFALGAWRRSGSMNGIAFLNCDICEVLIYDSALSTSDREDVVDYLTDKWAL